MSHIHLPDGVLPTWLWLSGYVTTALLVGLLWRWGKVSPDPRRFALLGIFSAIMILVMMIEIPPVSYHFNLSVVAGIVLGPASAVLAALIVNVILALIGHGGITVIGINALTLSAEMIAGYYAFRLFSRLQMRVTRAGFGATMVGLFVGTLVGYGFIAAGSRWIDQFLQFGEGEFGLGISGPHLNLMRLAIIMFGVGAVGWVLEGILTAAILGYLNKADPNIIARGGE